MAAPDLPEPLDHGDALHELDGRAGQGLRRLVVLHVLLTGSPHHQRVQEEDQHERHERRKRHPPVHNEEIDQAEKRHRDRGQDVLDRVRDKLVQRYDVVLHQLAHRTRAAPIKPAQWKPLQVANDPPAQRVLQFGIREMTDQAGHKRRTDAHNQRDHGDDHDHPDPTRIDRRLVDRREQHASQLDDRYERHHAAGRAKDRQHDDPRQTAPHRREERTLCRNCLALCHAHRAPSITLLRTIITY